MGPLRTVALCLGLVGTMLGASYAAVPLYDWFCRVTGFGGATGVAEASGETLEQTIKVRFSANVERGFPWEFRPVQREVELRIGETGLAFYEAHNPTDRPVAGSASYNVAPYEAGGFFVKIDCFCFEEQVLMPGETVQMPVTYFVDPEIVDDRDARFVHTITLSYTFHEIEVPEHYNLAATDPEG